MDKSDLYLKITSLLAAGAKDEAQSLLGGGRAVLSYPEYQECLGNLHFYSKEHQLALPYYEAAMESDPDYDCARYHYLLGVQAERAGQLTEAFERYQAAVGIEPGFLDSYVELGGLLCKVRDFEGALKCYTDASRIDPEDHSVHHNLVQILSELAKKDPATYSQSLDEARVAYAASKGSAAHLDRTQVW